MSVITFDVALAAKLKKALAKADWEEADINLLAESNKLRQIREVLLGRSTITVAEHVIDCDAHPTIPSRCYIEEHVKGGSLRWDVSEVELFLTAAQKDELLFTGELSRWEIQQQPVLNACVLDYLLVHPHLIPEEWRDKLIFFWGTVYRRPNHKRCVRYLYLCNRRGTWGWDLLDLGCGISSSYPALVRVR